MSWFDINLNMVAETSMKKATYLIEGETTKEVEARLAVLLRNYSMDYTIQSIKKVNYTDVFAEPNDTKYYKAKVGFIVLDEVNGVEKVYYNNFLFGASSFKNACEMVEEKFNDHDIKISSVVETKYTLVDTALHIDPIVQ